MKRFVHGVEVAGVEVDEETRCKHYHTSSDVIAIKFPCCNTYYSCRECHDALANHAAKTWPVSGQDVHAILCGVCGQELMIPEYLNAGAVCPNCQASFNPRCSLHYDLYFERNQ